jgi:hypothetical protein
MDIDDGDILNEELLEKQGKALAYIRLYLGNKPLL